MLTPDQIEALRLQSEDIIDPVVQFLIGDIAQRISEAGHLTSTAAYQVWRLQHLGVSQRQLKKELRKLLKVSHRELRKLLTQTAEVGYNYDIQRFPYVQAVPFERNEDMQRIVEAAVKLAEEDLGSLTQTLGFVAPNGKAMALTDAYREACDFAFKKVFTGAQDYNSAVREATKGLVDKGILRLDYDSGVHRSVEAAVRGSVMGGLGLLQEQISQQNHDDLGCNGWEISAHANSAPDHEPIQGKQYSDEEYERLNNSLKRQIGTLNCGHSASPIIMGIHEPQYTPEELEKFREDNEKGITYNGKHYTMYEATQRQRLLERKIRKLKRRILVDEKLGDTEQLSIDRTKYVVMNDEYKRFSKAAGLRIRHERMEMTGFGPKQHGAAEGSANAAHKEWLKSIGAEGTELNSLEKFEEARYNNTDEFQLLNGYDRAVKNGDISALVGFDHYKATGEKIRAGMVGQSTSTGVEIKSFTTHYIDRTIGQTSDAHPGMRQGVPVEDALDALQNPVQTKPIRHLPDGDIRQTFYGAKAVVTISLRDGKLIQTNPYKKGAGK